MTLEKKRATHYKMTKHFANPQELRLKMAIFLEIYALPLKNVKDQFPEIVPEIQIRLHNSITCSSHNIQRKTFFNGCKI